MAKDLDAALAELEQQRAELEQQQAARLARLVVELGQAGAAWNKARGNRKSLRSKGGKPHPTMTRLQAKIIEADAARMSGRAIATAAGVHRSTVSGVLAEQKHTQLQTSSED